MHIMYCKVFSNLSHEMCQESLLLTRCHCFRFKMHSVVRFIYLHTVHDFLRVWVGECGEAGAMLVLAVPNVKSIWPSASHHQSRHRDWALGTRYQGSHDYHNNLSIHSTSLVFTHYIDASVHLLLYWGLGLHFPCLQFCGKRNGVETNIRILIKIISLEYSDFD